MRRTKIICTIGPATNSAEMLQKLADAGMNIARLNMSHGDHEWHRDVIKKIHKLNSDGDASIAVMLDTKGPELRSGDLKDAIVLQKGDTFTFTIRKQTEYEEHCTEVNVDSFIDDVSVGDTILADGGILNFEITEKTDTDMICTCLNDGEMTSRRHLNIKGKTATLPTITDKDWEDIDFGIEEGVDFIALSFTKGKEELQELRSHLEDKGATIDIIAKVESVDAVQNLPEIVEYSDSVMVARGDLGSELPIEDVPVYQEEMIRLCRDAGKPVIVATQILESMIVHPTPTRAEVSDIAHAVMEGTDALMLCGETAAGTYPIQSVETMVTVSKRIEGITLKRNGGHCEKTEESKKEIAQSAATMANHTEANALLVITRRGYMATLLSRCRPCSPIYAFTNITTVRRKLNLFWGILPYHIEFSKDPEKTIQRAVDVLLEKKRVEPGDRIIIVSDILAGDRMVETVQVREV